MFLKSLVSDPGEAASIMKSRAEPPPTTLRAGRGGAGMKSGLRFAAVALLFLAGVLGVSEAARAQTVVWSATLQAGSSEGQAGYSRVRNYGTLSSRTFTYKGHSFALDSIYSARGFSYVEFAAGAAGSGLGNPETDLFLAGPVTLHIGSGSWMAPTQNGVVNFGGSLIFLYSPVVTAGNLWTVPIDETTAEGHVVSLGRMGKVEPV